MLRAWPVATVEQTWRVHHVGGISNTRANVVSGWMVLAFNLWPCQDSSLQYCGLKASKVCLEYCSCIVYRNSQTSLLTLQIQPTWCTIFLVCLFIFSTCFGQLCAHHQEKLQYQCDPWYLSLSVDDWLVCRVGSYIPVIHTEWQILGVALIQ